MAKSWTRNLLLLAIPVVMVVFAATAFSVTLPTDAQSFDGEWTLRATDRPGKVHLSLHAGKNGKDWRSSSDWSIDELQGLDLSRAGRQETQFVVERDAGRMEFEGRVEAGKGAGFFQFIPAAGFAQSMAGLGFPLGGGKHYAMFIHDVSLDFARDMKAADLEGLDTDHLIAFRIHGVTSEFIQGLSRAGLESRESDKLIAFRIHGVNPDLVAAVRQAGLKVDGDKLIAFQIHGVSPQLIEEFESVELSDLNGDELIAFRIHGVTPSLVREMRDLGVEVDADHLIAFRIHGVTPAKAKRLHAEGTPLEAEALISAMIHGGRSKKHR